MKRDSFLELWWLEMKFTIDQFEGFGNETKPKNEKEMNSKNENEVKNESRNETNRGNETD